MNLSEHINDHDEAARCALRAAFVRRLLLRMRAVGALASLIDSVRLRAASNTVSPPKYPRIPQALPLSEMLSSGLSGGGAGGGGPGMARIFAIG